MQRIRELTPCKFKRCRLLRGTRMPLRTLLRPPNRAHRHDLTRIEPLGFRPVVRNELAMVYKRTDRLRQAPRNGLDEDFYARISRIGLP